MKKILILAVLGVTVLASAVPSWANEACGRQGDRWSVRYESGYGRGRHGGSSGHYRPRDYYLPRREVVYVAAPVNNTVLVNVSNSNGSYTPVTLRREGGSYIGPRGERYLRMPTEEQLQRVYGLE